MGGILFYPYSSTNGFPTNIYIDAGGGVSFVLTVTYVCKYLACNIILSDK